MNASTAFALPSTWNHRVAAPAKMAVTPSACLPGNNIRPRLRDMRTLPRLETAATADPASSCMRDLSPRDSVWSVVDLSRNHSLALQPCHHALTRKPVPASTRDDREDEVVERKHEADLSTDLKLGMPVTRRASRGRRLSRKCRSISMPLVKMGKAVVPNVCHYGLALILDRPAKCHCPVHRDHPELQYTACSSDCFKHDDASRTDGRTNTTHGGRIL